MNEIPSTKMAFLCIYLLFMCVGYSIEESTMKEKTREATDLHAVITAEVKRAVIDKPLPEEQEISLRKVAPLKRNVRIKIAFVQNPTCQIVTPAEFVLAIVARQLGKFKCVSYQGSDSTILSRLQTGHVHIVIIPLSMQRNYSLSFLYPFHQNDLCLVVKRIGQKRRTIIQSFSAPLWLSTLACVVVFATTLWLSGVKGVVLETFRTFVTGAFILSTNFVTNGVFFLLSLFSLFIVSIFTGKFMSFLSVLSESDQPQTLEEVNSRISRVYSLPSLNLMEEIDPNDVTMKIFSKVINESTDEPIEAITTLHTVGTLIYQDVYEYLKTIKFFWANGQPLLYLVPERFIAPVFPLVAVSPLWPHGETFNKMLQQAVESGMYIYAELVVKYRNEWDNLRVERQIPNTQPQPLSMEAMLQPTVMLGIGLTIATILFLVEFVSGHWKKIAKMHATKN